MRSEKLLSLPPLPKASEGRQGLPTGVFVHATQSFVESLAEKLAGRRVLEVFSGNGFLAAHLAQRGMHAQEWGEDWHDDARARTACKMLSF